MNYSEKSVAEDTDQEPSTVTLTILPACHLGIVDGSVEETLTKDSGAEGAFSAGYVEFVSDKPTLMVNSNIGWKLTVKSSGFTGPYSKDIGDLQVKDGNALHVMNGFTDFRSLSEQDQEIASYNKGVQKEEHPCQYKILLDWEEDIPGTYEATVTYTLSTSGA